LVNAENLSLFLERRSSLEGLMEGIRVLREGFEVFRIRFVVKDTNFCAED
jgi:hypothetical protein